MGRDNRLEVVVLAAGQGTRMRSKLPKVLHELGGRPLISHVVDTARTLGPDRIHVVIGHGAEAVQERLGDGADLSFVVQQEQHGTGHAVMQAMPDVDPSSVLLILLGDVPLVAPETLQRCLEDASTGVCVVTVDMPDPFGFGRIVRENDGRIVGIVEEKDASDAERAIREINSGIMAAPASVFASFLENLGADNAQGEYYLTDIVTHAETNGLRVTGLKASSPQEVQGINDRRQLADLERFFQRRLANDLMAGGVTLADPSRVDIRGTVSAGEDCTIDVNVVMEGRVVLGEGVKIGPGSFLRDVELGDHVVVEANTVVDGAVIGDSCSLGPFARIRPGTTIGENARIGNFVEVKKANIGPGTKASHLAYLGDANLGADCNIGAGTITCNYDGVDKHQTNIGDRVFVGTNSTLVAPIEIGDAAYVAAGSTVTARVGSEDLAVGRARQRNIQGWTPPAKRK